MNCLEARKLFPLYYDSEGGAEVQFQIGDHLATCPECKAWFAEQTRSEAALADLLNKGQASGELWQRIESQLLAAGVTVSRPPAPLRGGVWLLALAASLLMAAYAWWGFFGDASADELARLAAREHESYVAGRWQADVVSESIEEVEQRLRPKAGFAVRCPPRGQAGFRLKGGGICRLETELTVHIVGEVGRQPISVFVLPHESLRSFPSMRDHLPAEGQVHRCREGSYEMVASLWKGHVVLVLGRVKSDVLAEILRGYGSHHASAAPQQTLALSIPR